MVDLNEYFAVHPRKRICRTPLYDWAGRTMPRCLDEVYGSYSTAKAKAYRYWKQLSRERFCITAHNTNFFTISFDFPNPETGEMMRAIATGRSAHAYYIDFSL